MRKKIFVILLSLLSLHTFARENFSESTTENNQYILTPKPSPIPRINGAKVFGVSPSAPILFKIAATGEKPLKYEIKNLPQGVNLDTQKGIITGSIGKKGTYILNVVVSNSKGKAEGKIKLVVGDTLSLTPPMGWNSWNAWGLEVSQEKVMASAKAFIEKGLIDYGWSYICIDDGWQDSVRVDNKGLRPNYKFPNMKGLSDWLHTNGMKFGIYSSPGPTTCGGYLGSYKHEYEDASLYNEWGVDYLKYDLCSYRWDIMDKGIDKDDNPTVDPQVKPYKIMRNALDRQPRDIIYSVCAYNTIPWVDIVGGNLTRLSKDIRDSWESLLSNGFDMDQYAKYNRPGRWNDPDMLVVGMTGGWYGSPEMTKLTPDEQYTHISLWCLFSAPLFIGCDVENMDDFTLSLLTNAEIIDVNQDPLGLQAIQKISSDKYKIFVKKMEDGSNVVGLFNISDSPLEISVKWSDLEINGGKVRDLWRQKDLGKFKDNYSTLVPPHGVNVISVK